VLLDREGCAAWLNISTRSLDTLRSKPDFPELKLGDSPRFEPEKVLAWMRGQAS
jgi:hypothetical protein